MRILGVLNNNLCILLEASRIIITTQLRKIDLEDLIEYENITIFSNYDEVQIAAFGV